MFSENNNIIPAAIRSSEPLLEGVEKKEESIKNTRECYFNLEEEEIEAEIEMIRVCEEREFYTLLKNEPIKYVSICEFNLEAKRLALEQFHFSINRDEKFNNLEIEFQFEEDERPVEIKFSEPLNDLEITDQLQTNLSARFNYSQRPISIQPKKAKSKIDDGGPGEGGAGEIDPIQDIREKQKEREERMKKRQDKVSKQREVKTVPALQQASDILSANSVTQSLDNNTTNLILQSLSLIQQQLNMIIVQNQHIIAKHTF